MRMNLTDEEAKIILRMREVENAHRAGWNKALDALQVWVDQAVGMEQSARDVVSARLSQMVKS